MAISLKTDGCPPRPPIGGGYYSIFHPIGVVMVELKSPIEHGTGIIL
jgi:hypothetical protein